MSYDQYECKKLCKMADADGFIRRETLDIFLGMLDKSELDHLFEDEMDNVRQTNVILRCGYRNSRCLLRTRGYNHYTMFY